MGLPPSCETTVKHAHAVGNIRRRSAHHRSSLRPSGRKSDVISYRPAVSRILAESSLSKPLAAAVPHDDLPALAALLGHRRDPAMRSESIVIPLGERI